MNQDERLIELAAHILKLPVQALTDEVEMQHVVTWDSLSHMELIAAIEDEFGVELTNEQIVNMTSIGRIRSIVVPILHANLVRPAWN